MQFQSKVGLYLTLIVHLIAVIIALICGIQAVQKPTSVFVIDFSKQEEIEKLQKEAEKLQKIEEKRALLSEELDKIIKGEMQHTRNVVVNRSNKPLKDDRFKNPQEVYDEANELQRKLDASKKAAMEETGDEAIKSKDKAKKDVKGEAKPYQGPSVLSYKLDGRKATSLPIPAYKGIHGGDVTVIILVDRNGYVVKVAIDTSHSSSDPILQDEALKAAKKSRFTKSITAPNPQQGEIVYRFIAQ